MSRNNRSVEIIKKDSETQLIVRPVEANNQNKSGEFIEVESTTTITQECFTIVLIEDTVEYEQSRFQRFFRHMERLLGFRIQLFRFSDSVVRPFKLLINKGQRILYIHSDFLKTPFKKFQCLMKELLLSLLQADNRLLRAFSSFSRPFSLFGQKNATMKLLVGNTGLHLPSNITFTASDQMVRVSISDIEISVRFANMRLEYRSTEPLPFFSYVVDLYVVDGEYVVAIPPQVLQALSSSGTTVQFQVYYD
ncbi:hypothetical protein [Paenibacillus senegalensis]|uniref:hypothetical protein n=1 Tax=Paenibacillus senegalensis TaxID=1465766 RepID=UPI000288C675|nr:hypothetical protein [Paenibacillus senegalensis]